VLGRRVISCGWVGKGFIRPFLLSNDSVCEACKLNHYSRDIDILIKVIILILSRNFLSCLLTIVGRNCIRLLGIDSRKLCAICSAVGAFGSVG